MPSMERLVLDLWRRVDELQQKLAALAKRMGE
jgi:hypothetical protein